MPSTFLAIPLPRMGESFLLRTTHQGSDRAVLVDTGWKISKDNLDNSLCSFLNGHMPDLRSIDRLILTHEDADHCQGAPQFIESWLSSNRTIDEVWLPALWAPAGAGPRRSNWVRSRIVKGAFEAAPEIARAVRETNHAHLEAHVNPPHPDVWEGEKFEETVRDVASQRGLFNEMFQKKMDESLSEGIAKTQQVEGDVHPIFITGIGEYIFENFYDWSSNNATASSLAIQLKQRGELPNAYPYQALAMKLACDALDSHKRISKTIAACIAFGIPIRWFDFKQFENDRNKSGAGASGGDEGFLTPVNAVEVVLTPSSVSPEQIFYALTLSRANRESLVFLRHEEENEPAVLFTADSRLTTHRKPFSKPEMGFPSRSNLIVTALHHASSHNQDGYAIFKNWLGEQTQPILVRNGGHKVKSAANGFLEISNRVCVRCIDSSLPDILVRIEAKDGIWCMPNHPRSCACQ